MTHKESRGKAYVEGQWEAGTRVYRSRKEAQSGMTKESREKAYIVGQREAGDSVYRSGMDGVVRGHWMSYLQMV